MIRRLIGFVALASMLQTGSASAQDKGPLVMAASANWVVDFADDYCSIRRTFESDGRRAMLEFRSYGLSPAVDVRLISDTIGVRRRLPIPRFAPASAVRSPPSYLILDGAGGWRGVAYRDELPPDGAQVTAYRVSDSFDMEIELTTGPLAEVAQVLRSCEDDLLTTLGLDPAATRTLSRPIAVQGTETWLGVTSAVQRDMLLQGSAYQNVRLLVDETGKAFGCRVIDGGVDAALSDRMCSALQSRARLGPALDAQGSPVRSMYMLSLASAASAR